MKRFFCAVVMSTLVITCGGAFAKSGLKFAIPFPDSIIAVAPLYYMLDFEINMDKEKTSVTLTGPDGLTIALAPEEPYDNTAVGKITGKELMGPGVYTLSWRHVGPSGTPASGSYNFTITR